ncbi:MAG TPA: SpoIIE family protein phosphatase [Pirellulaceae bacterium]|nr:SpoIIE family protein phosphatase [Pirellulaceae bacterium]
MAKQIPSYLKLHAEEATTAPSLTDLGSLEMLYRSFAKATGWTLRYEPVARPTNNASATGTLDNSAGLLLTPAPKQDEDPRPRIARQEIEPLAASLALLLGELDRTRKALWQREAELAAGVPIACRNNEEAHLATRLAAALQAGCQAVGCQAAAFYLLDESTSQLKLRASFGLPAARLLDDARPLRGAMADLEALIGHAVVIEDTQLLPHWRCPEDFAAAVCVPVSTPSTPLGTLWIFSEKQRDFTSEQTNVIELVAGRLASDLEREMLISQGMQSRTLDRDLDQAARWQEERLPSIAPLVNDWDLAGQTQTGDRLSSEFFDWSVLPDGMLAVGLGDAAGQSVIASLSAASFHAAVKSHANYRHSARQMLERVNDTLWSCSPGGQFASLVYGLILPHSGEFEFATAGEVGALIVHPEGHVCLSRSRPPLGQSSTALITASRHVIPAGAALVLVSDGVLQAADAHGNLWNEAAIAEFLRLKLHLSAQELSLKLRDAMQLGATSDRTLLVVKRVR